MSTAGTLMTSFDVLIQQTIDSYKPYDYRKTSINCFVGTAAAPWLFFWYTKIQPKISSAILGRTASLAVIQLKPLKVHWSELCVRVIADYFVCFPVMQLLYHTGFNLLYTRSAR